MHMKSLQYAVKNPLGIHARPAALLAQACTGIKSNVTLEYEGKTASGKNVLQILALQAKKGSVLNITAEGPDEDKAIEIIQGVLSEVAPQDRSSDILRVAFYGTKDYDRLFFSELSKDKGEGTYNVDITYFSSRLTIESAHLAEGFDAVCIFVNDEAPREVIKVLAKGGVRLILLRCAGFNNVDAEAAKEYGIKVLRVPAYSPYAVAEHAMTIIQAANRRIHKSYIKVKDPQQQGCRHPRHRPHRPDHGPHLQGLRHDGHGLGRIPQQGS